MSDESTQRHYLEAQRLLRAQPEIQRLDELERRWESMWSLQSFSPSSFVTAMAELRKIVELRSQLRGVLPPKEENEHG